MDNAQKTAMFKANATKALALAPEHPWNHTDPALLGPVVTSFIELHEPYFRRWAESWFMTMQFVFGNHHMKWSPRMGFAVDFDTQRRRGSRSPVKAYTNVARIAIESLTAGLYANMPIWDIEAIDTGAVSGRRQKKIMGGLLDGLFQTLLMDKDASAAAFVFSMFGQMAFDSDWNPMAGRVIEMQRFAKTKKPAFTSYMAPNVSTGGLIETPTGVTDSSGRPYLEETWDVQKDGMGREIIDRILTGNPTVNVRTPFEYRRALGSVGMHKSRYVQTFDLLDYDKWLDLYGQIPGKTRFFDDVQPVYGQSAVWQFALRFFMRMTSVTPPSEEDYGARWGYAIGNSLRHKVLVVNHYDEPHPNKWPQGRRLVIANGACTHITKPNYNTGKLDGWHPLSEAQWINSYPSSVATGPMQDLVKKNKEVNVLDTYIAMAVRRTLGGQYLVGTKSGLDPERLTGEPGLAHMVTDPFAVRILHDEIPISPVVQQIRASNMEDAYNQSGALDAQRGSTDDKAKSGYQAKINEEREEKRLSPSRKAFRTALAGAGEKMLVSLHTNAVELDKALMGYLVCNAAGDFTPDDVIAFMSRPLPIGTQVKIVENSMALKSKATQQATMQELAQGPLATRLGQDAKVLDKYLKAFDMETLRDSSAAHRDRAERENETFLDMARLGFDVEGLSLPIVLFEDDDDIHINEHTDFIVKYWDTVRDNKDFLMQYYIHCETHRIQGDEKKAKVMPGTSLQVGNMVQQASQVPLPSMQTIQMQTQLQKMQAQQAQAQNPQAQAPNPGQGKRMTTQPKPGAPPGARPTAPGAPAQTGPAAGPPPPGGANGG